MSEDDKKKVNDLKIKKVTIDGDTATIKSEDIEGAGEAAKSDVKLKKVDGEWYMDAASM